MSVFANIFSFFLLLLWALTAKASVVDVNITEFGLFSPPTITVTDGDSIRFVNQSDSFVEPASDPHPTHGNYTALNVGLIDPNSFATTPALTRVGIWGYHDHLASSITGTITVAAKGSNSGTSCDDCLAPGVYSPIANPINNQSVLISWRTDEPAISRIEFGTTTNYGSTTVLTSDFITNHSLMIKGLQPRTFYYYRLFVKDSKGNGDFSQYLNQTFRTSPIEIEAIAETVPEKPVIITQKEEIIKEVEEELRLLQDALYKALLKSNFAFSNGLEIGSRGAEVQILQILLSQDNSVYPEKKITGYFGPLTEGAVRRFQEKYGIEIVGAVGPKTRVKLNQLIGR